MFMRVMLSAILLLNAAFAADESAVMRVRASRNQGNTTITQHGSCVAVNAEEFNLPGKRWILTAAHVVSESGSTVMVEIAKDRWLKCRVARMDTKSDLALLHAAEDLPAVVKVEKEDDFRIIASSEGRPVTIQHGVLQQSQAKCAMAHGMSGGAVLNKNGNLQGIIVSGVGDGTGKMRPDTSIFVTAKQIREFLQDK